MSKIRKLVIVGVVALMMMLIAAPAALAQDWCYYGCNPAYWGVPADTSTTTPEPDYECGWVWSYQEDDWVWACWRD